MSLPVGYIFNPPRKFPPRFKDITGVKIGRWTVLEKRENDSKGCVNWLCVCECGTRREVSSHLLNNGTSLSCGCLRKERARRANALPSGMGAARCLYIAYSHGARNRHLKFELTFERFLELCSGICVYCGTPPSDVSMRPTSNGPFIHNGIDKSHKRL